MGLRKNYYYKGGGDLLDLFIILGVIGFLVVCGCLDVRWMISSIFYK